MDRSKPAFARPYSEDGNGTDHHAQEGMTLRDYFAAKAMQGMLINNEYLKAVDGVALRHGDRDHAPTLANAAYNYADAMLKERNK